MGPWAMAGRQRAGPRRSGEDGLGGDGEPRTGAREPVVTEASVANGPGDAGRFRTACS